MTHHASLMTIWRGGGDDKDVVCNVDLVTKDNDHPAMVKFACNTFFQTLPRMGTKIVILNPFSGSLSMHCNVLS
jgi:hypothetical protein